MSFSHLKNKKEVQMVDISKKKSSSREARAAAILKFSSKTFKKIIKILLIKYLLFKKSFPHT